MTRIYLIAALVLALLAGIGVQTVRLADAHAATAKAETALANEKADRAEDVRHAAQAALVQSETYRAEEQRRMTAQKAIDDDTHTKFAAAQADAASAAGAAQQLRERIAAVTAAARRAATDSAIAEQRTATTDPIGMLADVLGRADARAGLLADLADRRGIAGAACERSYDALMQASPAVALPEH